MLKTMRQRRLERVAPATTVPRVRVLPANDDLRRVLKHPITGMRFRETGSVEWPLDTFTKRRLREGSITIEERKQEAAPSDAKEPGDATVTREKPEPHGEQQPQPVEPAEQQQGNARHGEPKHHRSHHTRAESE